LNQSRSLVSLVALALFGLILVGLVWADYRFAHSDISGEGFSIQWISIQSLENGGNDPYDDQVTARIRQSVSKEDAFVLDIYPKYTSPLYSGVLIFPFTLTRDTVLGHALWLTTQLFIIFGMIFLCVRMTAWKINRYSFFLFSLFTVFSYHVVIPWLDGGLPIWAAFFLVSALVAIGANRNEVGGVFLALATVQPQMVVLPVIFILIWSISKKKAVIVLWFIITLVLLSAIGLFIVPGWVIQYTRLVYHFSENFPPGNLQLFFSSTFPGMGKQLGWLVSGISIIILIIEWLLALRKDLHWFLWTVCLTMVISQWVGIPTIPGNFIELIIPLILIFAMLTERWPVGGQWAAVIMAAILLVWEWGIFYLDLHSPQPAMQLNLLFPLPAVLLICLYWVRWWAIKPRRLLIEEMRLSESY
jgi:hypothetical protein